jgi:DNA-binding LacI/PurR family transcriptional regulator
MADVARLSGVSHQTVSRVVNGTGYVAVDTRERVVSAMRMLGYRPNPAARALVTGRSRTIGVVSFDPTLYGPASTLAAIEQAAQKYDYYTSIVGLRSLERTSLPSAIERLHAQGVDGVLVIAPLLSAVNALAVVSTDVPLVALEAGPEHGIPVVAVDQRTGASAATRHLLDLGHATVFHLAGPPEFQEAAHRLAGWRDTLQSANARAPTPLHGDWSARSGYDLGRQVLAGERPTAVFVANDQMALGLLRAVQEAGMRVPEDMSVVGFDDIPEAAYFAPPLTTVRQEFTELGELGVQLLLEQIEAGATSRAPTTIEPELIVRASTAAPR